MQVSVDQFRKFVKDTGFSTEAEKFGWSFVHEMLLSKDTLKLVDGKQGMGRVKSAPHWCGVEGVYWRRPEGWWHPTFFAISSYHFRA
jgi:formylglycine-generating enzyme required for sulfatase activity